MISMLPDNLALTGLLAAGFDFGNVVVVVIIAFAGMVSVLKKITEAAAEKRAQGGKVVGRPPHIPPIVAPIPGMGAPRAPRQARSLGRSEARPQDSLRPAPPRPVPAQPPRPRPVPAQPPSPARGDSDSYAGGPVRHEALPSERGAAKRPMPARAEERSGRGGLPSASPHQAVASALSSRGRLEGNQSAADTPESPDDGHVGAFDLIGDLRHPSLANLRRAILMSEVLGPPVALRNE